jgi:hypothetical protein
MRRRVFGGGRCRPQSIVCASGVTPINTNLSVGCYQSTANSRRSNTELDGCSKIGTPPGKCRGGWFDDAAPTARNFENLIAPFERAEFICLEREAARHGNELRTSYNSNGFLNQNERKKVPNSDSANFDANSSK